MRLQGGFTLRYLVTVQDLRSPATRAAEMEEERQGIDRAVREGHIAADQKDRYLADATRFYGQSRPIERFLIMLASRDGTLLYKSTRGSRIEEPTVRQVVILDGADAYEADGTTAAAVYADGGETAGYQDQNVDRLAFCPLPGVGLPGVDLMRSPKFLATEPDGDTRFSVYTPLLNLSTGGETPYKAGEAVVMTTQGRLKVVSLVVGTQAMPSQTILFDRYRLFQGHWIAGHIQMTSFEDAGDKSLPDLPTTESDFQIQGVSGTPPSPVDFDIATYLVKGARVADDATGNSVFFTFDPEQGSFRRQDDQARAQKSLPDIVQEKP